MSPATPARGGIVDALVSCDAQQRADIDAHRDAIGVLIARVEDQAAELDALSTRLSRLEAAALAIPEWRAVVASLLP